MKFLFLPSSAQRPRKSGVRQPNRIYVQQGDQIIELTNLVKFSAECAPVLTGTHAVGIKQCGNDLSASDRVLSLTLEFSRPRLATISKKPRKRP